MRITFVNQKGGVGKSTVCIAVGAALKEAGFNVAFEDSDPQGSVRFWAKEVGKIPMVEDAKDPAVVLTDTPGHLAVSDGERHQRLCDLIKASHRLVIVSEKSLFSIHATTPMVRLVHANRNEDARVFLLLNKVRSKQSLKEEQTRQVAFRLGVPLLTPHIPMAASFEHLQTQGISALKPKHLEIVLKIAMELVQ